MKITSKTPINFRHKGRFIELSETPIEVSSETYDALSKDSVFLDGLKSKTISVMKSVKTEETPEETPPEDSPDTSKKTAKDSK